MPIKNDEVRKIAHLASLRVEEDDIGRYALELAKILAFVDQMNAVDTSGVEPMAHPLDATQRLRPDVVTEPDNHQAFQAIAPSTEDDLYLVPKVIE